MEQAEIKYPHDNGEIVVLWRPKLCQHSGICVKMLPAVYNPKDRPWIKPDSAETKQLIEQIEKCPSGALGYKLLV